MTLNRFSLPIQGTFEMDEEDDDDYEYSDIVDPTEKACQMIDIYFKDKQLHCGGSIPRNQLYSDKNIRLVRDCSILDTNRCYEVIHNKPPTNNGLKNEDVTWDVDLLMQIWEEMNKKKICKEYKVGIALLHLHFCMGYPLPEKIYRF